MEINLQRLDTEQVNENTKNIDNLSTLDMVTVINNEDKKVALAVEKVLPNIANAVDETYKRIKCSQEYSHLFAKHKFNE